MTLVFTSLSSSHPLTRQPTLGLCYFDQSYIWPTGLAQEVLESCDFDYWAVSALVGERTKRARPLYSLPCCVSLPSISVLIAQLTKSFVRLDYSHVYMFISLTLYSWPTSGKKKLLIIPSRAPKPTVHRAKYGKMRLQLYKYCFPVEKVITVHVTLQHFLMSGHNVLVNKLQAQSVIQKFTGGYTSPDCLGNYMAITIYLHFLFSRLHLNPLLL